MGQVYLNVICICIYIPQIYVQQVNILTSSSSMIYTELQDIQE